MINNNIIDFHIPFIKVDFFSYSFEYFFLKLVRNFIYTDSYEFQCQFPVYATEFVIFFLYSEA